MKQTFYVMLLCLSALQARLQTPEQEYKKCVREHRCHGNTCTNCLKLASYMATRSNGSKVKVDSVYDWVGDNVNNHFIKPHFLKDYLHKLREAYVANTTYAGQLYNEIDFMISRAVDRNGALVWENNEGIAQGFDQIEFANFLITAAAAYKSHNDLKMARGLMNYSRKFFRAADIQAGVRTGGIASITTYCGSNKTRARPCYWFHSRGVSIEEPGIPAVLNQHLHVVTLLLEAYINIRRDTSLIEPEFGSARKFLNFLLDKAIGGLDQLVFSEGHKGVAPTRPPNISQFMHYVKGPSIQEHLPRNIGAYYLAFYKYDMSTGKGVDIKISCHYHTHVLNLVAGIQKMLDENRAIFAETPDSEYLDEAMHALLKGRGEQTGMEGSTSAIYQFYRSVQAAYRCDSTHETLSEDAIAIYSKCFDQ